MYFLKPEGNIEDYKEVKVKDKIFYKLKSKDENTPKKKKRYSDVIKEPSFIQKDKYRKLNMIKAFKAKNGDLEENIEKWKEIIENCICILKKDYEILPSEIFKIFNLEEYGFNLEDYE